MGWNLPLRAICSLLLCFGFWLSSGDAVRIQTIAEAKEALLLRELRQVRADTSTPSPSGSGSYGSGIFGNESLVLNVTNCFLMETLGVAITVQQLTKSTKSLNAVITSNMTTATVSGECSPQSENGTGEALVTVTLNGINVDANVSVAIFTMLFKQDRFNWQLHNLSLSVSFRNSTNNDEVLSDVPLDTKELFASRGSSYYCNNQLPFRGMHGSNVVSLYFQDLIIEPFLNDTSLGFSPIENCEYAFSIGIWMGIITALIMGCILFLGISMLASMRNMDRFDDPKTSKLLSVPNE